MQLTKTPKVRDLLYKLRNPPTMSHVLREEDLYSIMTGIMREAAEMIEDQDDLISSEGI